MAYVSKEKKAKIAEALKAVMPKDWKYSLAVRHHSTIVLTIRSAPVDLVAEAFEAERRHYLLKDEAAKVPSYMSVNHYNAARAYGEDHIFVKIAAALNTDNYDRSDSQSDYFDVGHYVDINIGKWDKPFIVTAAA